LLSVISAGGQPDYRCLLPTGVLVNETLPPAYNGSLFKCEMYIGNNETETCTDWEYFGDIGQTIVSQVTFRTHILAVFCSYECHALTFLSSFYLMLLSTC